ncbi:MAG: hypothetical protein K8R23_07840 [Chthoniobacter sp.]|nr:hypothetical protein [Chthoniobacter sp.]
MADAPDWRPAAWLYGGGFVLLFAVRWIFRGMLATPGGRVKLASRLTVTLIYGALVFALVFALEVTADVTRHFGPSPLGVPVRVIIWCVVTLLYLPFFFTARHLFPAMLTLLLIVGVTREPGAGGKLGRLRFFFPDGAIPDAGHSRRIAVAMAAYGILLLVLLGLLGTRLHDH